MSYRIIKNYPESGDKEKDPCTTLPLSTVSSSLSRFTLCFFLTQPVLRFSPLRELNLPGEIQGKVISTSCGVTCLWCSYDPSINRLVQGNCCLKPNVSGRKPRMKASSSVKSQQHGVESPNQQFLWPDRSTYQFQNLEIQQDMVIEQHEIHQSQGWEENRLFIQKLPNPLQLKRHSETISKHVFFRWSRGNNSWESWVVKKKHQTPGGVLKWGGTPKIHPSLFGMFRYKLQTIQLLGYLSYGNLHIYFTKGPRAWCMFETEKKSSNLNLYNETSSCNLWVQT